MEQGFGFRITGSSRRGQGAGEAGFEMLEVSADTTRQLLIVSMRQERKALPTWGKFVWCLRRTALGGYLRNFFFGH